MSLIDLANQYLFGPMRQQIEDWPRDQQGYCIAMGDVHCTPLELASFGQMMLDNGFFRGNTGPSDVVDRRVPRAVLGAARTAPGSGRTETSATATFGGTPRSTNTRSSSPGAMAASSSPSSPGLDMVVVTTAHDFVGDFTDNSWNTEGAIMRLIGTDVLPAAY